MKTMPTGAALAFLLLLAGGVVARADQSQQPVAVLEQFDYDIGSWQPASSRLVGWGRDAALIAAMPMGLEGVDQVAVGDDHVLALMSDGTVVAWGRPGSSSGDPSQGRALTRFGPVYGIAAGAAHSYALMADGTVVAWGLGGSYIVPGVRGVVKLAARNHFVLGLKGNGTLAAWGDDWGEIALPAGLTDMVDVAQGYLHCLALRRDGTVVAWGMNGNGECNVPANLGPVKSIAAGSAFSVALLADGTVTAWGSNAQGQLDVPAGLSDVVWIKAGLYHALALKKDGSLVRWGDRNTEQPPLPPVGGVVDMAAGISADFVIVRSITLDRFDRSWAPSARSLPLRLRNPSTTTAINGLAPGFDPVTQGKFALASFNKADTATFALDPVIAPGKVSKVFQIDYTMSADVDTFTRLHSPNGTERPLMDATVIVGRAKLDVVDVFGERISLTGETKVKAFGPITVPEGLNHVSSLVAGPWNSAALNKDGTVAVWGFTAPNVIPPLTDVTSVAVGADHFLFLNGQRKVVGLGPGYGNLKVIEGLANVTAVAAGEYHSLALKADGTVVAWGDNTYGECNVPKGLKGVTAIAGGASGVSLALKIDGTVTGWGENRYGASKPPANLKKVKAIGAGRRHSLALKTDGTVVAWGDTLGANPKDPPAGLAGVTAIAASETHNLALKDDGTVVGWGDNSRGQLTMPAGLDGVIGVAAGGNYSLALMEGASTFAPTVLGHSRVHHLSVKNIGSLKMELSGAVLRSNQGGFKLEGVAAYKGPYDPPVTLGSTPLSLTITFTPTHVGPHAAYLEIYSPDRGGPFTLLLTGYGKLPSVEATAAKPGTVGATFTAGPLRSDPLTGVLLQRLVFTNISGYRLEGLRLAVSHLASGLWLHSSYSGETPGTTEVLYRAPIGIGETVSFDLVYQDAYRRNPASLSPVVEALPSEYGGAGGMFDGTLVPLRSVRDTPQGPLLDFATKRTEVYGVEYSDNGGITWNGASQVFSATIRVLWIDRGPPATISKPLNKAARIYRLNE
ncbi:MAG: Alpha-tubulin suppressor [Verrucomicrobiaceae bacterium]|nr:Alpha-tubulin suppressor [Verrucomicrobiaceae bacterium]